MAIEIREVGVDSLPLYATTTMAFQVESVLRVEPQNQGLGGFLLVEEKLDQPYTKDYDRDDEDDRNTDAPRPVLWTRRFDVRNWAFLLAFDREELAGGATVAFDTSDVYMLEGRRDLAVLWDIRVAPSHQRRGVGAKLFQYAAAWARSRACRQLKIETQNVNVPACRFYAAQGCELGAIHRYAYHGQAVKQEAMLLWYLQLQ